MAHETKDSEQCQYVLTTDDDHSATATSSCSRPVWQESDRCVWHAEVDEKPVEALSKIRDTGPERLDGAYLAGVDFTGGAPLSFVDYSLRGANLHSAQLPGVDLTSVDLTGAVLSDTNLRDATISDAELTETTLAGATLENADLHGSDLSSADLSNADLREANLKDVNLQEATLREAVLGNATLATANLKGAVLVDADLRDVAGQDVTFEKTDLTDASLANADLPNASFGDATFAGIKLTDAGLRGADLQKADLSGVDIGGADLSDADLRGAVLTGTRLEESLLSRAELAGATLVGAALNGTVIGDARISESTTFGDLCRYDPSFRADEVSSTESTPDKEAAMRVYRSLERVTGSNGFAQRARHYYIRYKEMQRRRFKQSGQRGRWLLAEGSRFVFQYGESPWRVVLSGFFVVVLFGLFYSVIIDSLLEGLYHSALIFTTLGLDNLDLGARQGIIVFEAALGIVLFSLLVFVLGRRTAR